MSFSKKAPERFFAPANIKRPGGGVETLPITWRHKRTHEADEWLSRVDTDRKAALLEVIDSWDVPDFPFSAENLDELLQEYPGSGRSLVICYYAALHGDVNEGTVRKN